MASALTGSLVLDVPPDFHQLPVDDAIEDRMVAQRALVDAMGVSDARRREGLGLYVETLARHVRDSRVAASAFCLVELDGAPSTATLTVALHAAGSRAGSLAASATDPTVLVLGTAEVLRRDGGYGHVGIERISGRSLVVATADRADPDGSARHREVTVAVPLAEQGRIALVAMASPDRVHWATYERLARQVAGSVRVSTTEPTSQPTS